ncbi:MAG: peptide MFS transporter [Alistipes sp.]
MFKGQPKGLYALALANTGERFGYYTMLAIFVLFLQAKFGFTGSEASSVYSTFLAVTYFMPLIGGILADKFGYGRMVTAGIAVMFIGYLLMAMPTGTDAVAEWTMYGALFLVACGTGLFKGNLQVMVGNLYDAPEYSSRRDSAFSLFYMAINIGALFAPSAAEKITQWVLGKSDMIYNAQIPALAHQLQNGTIVEKGTADLTALAQTMPEAFGRCGNDLAAFGSYYIDQLSVSYHYAFGVACLSLILSAAIYFVFRSTFKHADQTTKQAAANNKSKVVELTPKQTRERIIALLLVFTVVIFFWMAFHQNGLTMTFFARDYTAHTAVGLERLEFSLLSLVLIIASIYASFSFFQSDSKRTKTVSASVFVVALLGLLWNYYDMGSAAVEITPQKFQQFNPFFVVALTPVSLAIFGALAKRGKEPSAPRKIGYGMMVAAIGFAILTFVSFRLSSPAQLADVGGASPDLVSPNWLISTYLVLTFAELLLSPMGISFVSKVAPPKYKGAMMGCWFGATAIGNKATEIIGRLWGSALPLWAVWSVLIVCCILSAVFIFSIMKKLDHATENA